MLKLFKLYVNCLDFLRDLPLLIFRLILAYGFYGPAKAKISNIPAIIEWFGSLGIPYPTINAYMAIATETSGVVLMILGLATRIISIPMMVVMVVAVVTVHWKHGFECGHNGFEIPFYYFCMLFMLLVYGAGRFSLDRIIAKKFTFEG